MVIANFIVDLVVDMIGEVIGYFIPEFGPKSKFEKNVERLKEEVWFSELEKDYRYAYIIYENRKIKKFLKNEKNVKKILTIEEERESFIRFVKEEHAKFTNVR